MQQVADFHIHSKYSRACSRDLNLENINKTCRVKGVDIIGTGDFTFPDWFRSIEEDLTPCPSPYKVEGDSGLYRLKKSDDDKVKFILTTELALIYKKRDKCRRIHIVLHAPNIDAVRELNNYLDKKYNIRSDGRPILGMSSEELVKLCLSIHPKFLIYPAHIWTPWFSVFGSKSGFNTFEECFGEYTKDINAYETGLSSDPEMNWRLSALDNLTLLSNSDAHSLPNLAREANVFEMDEASYDKIYNIITSPHPNPSLAGRQAPPAYLPTGQAGRTGRIETTGGENKDIFLDSRLVGNDNRIKYTIEFYPEEGMYHFDGHRDCEVRFSPEQTKKNKGVCPVCKKPLTIGVMYRVDELADRPAGFKPEVAPGFKKLVELDKIIAQALNIKSRSAQKVKIEYDNLIKNIGNEIFVLTDAKIEDIETIAGKNIAEGVKRVRDGRLSVLPGFDGQYGEVRIFNNDKKEKQKALF
jgi:PHP family Zn ribbon phosphoesterase